MLGNGLGKKVDAQFVKQEYHTFLNQSAGTEVKPKPLTKEERRADARKKGIFVVADDNEFTPTVFETPSCPIRPAVSKNAQKPLCWKSREVRTRRSKSKSAASPAPNSGLSKAKKHKKDKKTPKIPKAPREKISSSGPSATELSDQPSNTSMRVLKESPDKAPKPRHEAKEVVKSKKQPAVEVRKSIKAEPSQDKKEKKPETPVVVAEEAPESSIVEEAATPDMRKPSPDSASSKSVREGAIEEASWTTVAPPISTPLPQKDDVFAAMEDEEFEKFLKMENAALMQAEKKTIVSAQKILRIAHREKAFEKILTKEENETLAQFFSGRLPYNDEVLKTLDKAMDKTIEWIKKNKIKLDPETKMLIDSRGGNFKSALFEAILTSPKYLPKSWAKTYAELVEQSKKETQGINFAKILLLYPPQKSLDDGPEDAFGNFTRRKRHWFLCIFLGPSNSKSFSECDRVAMCKGLYMDTSLIEKAKNVQESGVDSEHSLMDGPSPIGTAKNIALSKESLSKNLPVSTEPLVKQLDSRPKEK